MHAPSSGRRFRSTLAIVQSALTLVLLSAALSMAIGFVKLKGVDLGFQTDGVATLSVSLPGSKAEANSATRQYYTSAIQRWRDARVETASAVNYIPLSKTPFYVINYTAQDSNQSAIGGAPVIVGPDYFRAIGTRILAGREFTDRDTAHSEPVAVVNDEFARDLTNGNPAAAVGRVINDGKRALRIAGVSRSMLYWGPTQTHAFHQVYTPISQNDWPSITFLAKLTNPRPGDLARPRSALQEVDTTVPVFDVKWFSDRWNEAIGKGAFIPSQVWRWPASG